MRNRVVKLCVAFLLTSASCLPFFASAHTFHFSFSEIDRNRERDVLEVALKVVPEELEQALGYEAQEDVNLDLTENIDQMISRYLQKTFRVTANGDRVVPHRWIGKDVSHKAAWLYFEIPCAELDNDFVLENRVLFDMETSQVNTVNYRDGSTRETITFTVDAPKNHLGSQH